MRGKEAPQQVLRDVSRAAIRAHVTKVGVELFDEHGVEKVTVEQLARAAGISVRSFHRYFAAKEDVIVGDPTDLGEIVRAALQARPASEPIWTSLRLAYAAMLEQSGADERLGKRIISVMSTTPALRARNLEKHLVWASMLTPIVQGRLPVGRSALDAETIVQTSLACLDVALTHWASSEDAPVSQALENTFAAVAALRP